MSTAAEALDIDAAGIRREGMRIAGERVERARTIAVHNPYTGALVGTVPKATVDDVRRALDAGWRVLKLAGLDPEGFVAPAYAYTPALRQQLRVPGGLAPEFDCFRHGVGGIFNQLGNHR